MNKNEKARVFDAHSGFVSALVFLANGFLASGGEDKMIMIWECSTLNNKHKFLAHRGVICRLAMLPNGDFASCSADTEIKVWRMDQLMQTIRIHSQSVHSMSVFALEGRLLTASHDKQIAISDSTSGKLLWRVHHELNSTCDLPCIHLNNLAVVSSSRFLTAFSSSIHVWQQVITISETTTNFQLVFTFHTDTSQIISISLMSNECVVVNSRESKICVWDLKDTKRAKKTWMSHKDGMGLGPLAVLLDDKVVCCAGNVIKIREPINGKTVQTTCAKHVCPIRTIAVNGELIASASNDTISLLIRKKE